MSIKSAVSLYSLQYQFLEGKMNLEDMFKFVKELGVEGIEILPDQMLRGAPHISDEGYNEWDRLVNNYGLDLACVDVFLNTNLYKNRELTRRECIELLKQEIIMANRLGFKVIRLVSMVPAWIIEPLLPFAEKYDVQLAIEIHGGLGFGVPKTEEFLAEVLRLDSPYVGIIPDASCFMHRLPEGMCKYCREFLGTSEEIIDYANKTMESGTDFFALKKKYGTDMDPTLKSLIKSDGDAFFAGYIDSYENVPLSVMDPYVKYIKHFHFKFYDMMEDGTEHSIDFRKIVEYLHKNGYNGYVSSEYEGNRWILPGVDIPDKEQLTVHQKLIQRLVKEIEG